MTLIWAAAVAAAVLGAFSLTAIRAASASADSTVTVNTTGDETQAGDGTCSLREALLYASGTPERDCAPAPASGSTKITLPPGTYLLGGTALTLGGDAAISGAGATITAGSRSQVLVIGNRAHVSISGVTVTGGFSSGDCNGQTCVADDTPVSGIPGAGIANAGTLTLTGVTVSGNRTGQGGPNPFCTIDEFGCNAGNGGDGGGINNTGTLTIVDSTISANATGPGADGAGGGNGAANGGSSPGATGSNGGFGGFGGGIENEGQLVMSGTTIAGNHTAAGGKGGDGGIGVGGAGSGRGGAGGNGGSGGGIDTSADMTITNSTVVGNATAAGGIVGNGGSPLGILPLPGLPGNGGGIDQSEMGSTLTHVTIASNTAVGAGGGIDGDGGTITAGNSIAASNLAGGPSLNCAGVIIDQGGNLEFNGSSCPPGFLRADPKLATLADNGGPTQTLALLPGSAAVHRVSTCVLGADQRGVARPVASACDSGAYQVATPSLGGPAVSAVTTASATVSTNINPNLRDATIVVNYGPTTNYGFTTQTVRVGAGNSPLPFSASLGGLTPGTTYHVDVVATNADGTSTSSDGVFTTLPALSASIAGAATAGPTLSLTLVCTGGSGPGTCSGPISLSARGATKHRGKHGGDGPQVVAAGVYSVASGGQVTVRMRLNPAGMRLLAAQYVLPTTLSLGGTTPMTLPVTFSYPVITSGVGYTWGFGATSSTARELTVTRIPQGGKVKVICHGGGCPFVQRVFAARNGRVVLTPAFKGHPLQAGATLVLEVIAANHVGKVETFKIRGGRPPAVGHECLPPGTSRPARCV